MFLVHKVFFVYKQGNPTYEFEAAAQQHPLLLLHIQNQTKNNKIMMQVFVGKKKEKEARQ